MLCSKGVLKGPVKQKERMGMGAVFKKTSGHGAAIMVLVWFTCLQHQYQVFCGWLSFGYAGHNYSEVNCEMNFKGWTL